MNIDVGNFVFSTTAHDLHQLCERYGAVDKITRITDHDTGRSRGYSCVEMPDSHEAQSALQGLQGKTVEGRTLHVSAAKPRASRRDPGRSRW